MKKKFKSIFSLALIASSLIINGCFEKDEPEPSNCAQLEHDLERTTELAEEFGVNPTKSRCTTLRQDQISLLNKMLDCPAYDKEHTESLLNFWKNYDCSIF